MYDAVVIGGGPGGYVCAIRVAQLGGKVVLIEKDKLGGVCANTGCIPTKSLYSSVELIRRIKIAKSFGIVVTDFETDFPLALKRANLIGGKSAKGVELLLKSNDVEVIHATAEIVDSNTLLAGGQKIQTRNIVIATGSSAIELPFARFDGKTIFSSEELWHLNSLPKSLVIIGGGYEGVEFANIFNAFGCEVTIVELMDKILPREDQEVSEYVQKTMQKEGVNILTGKMVSEVNGTTVKLKSGEELKTEKVLVVVGRKPNLFSNLGKLGVGFDKRGININSRCQTSASNIYAIGDVAKGGLAHVASYQGEIAAQNIMGKASEFNPVIPYAIFSHPEVACVGAFDGKVGKFPFLASGKALTMGEKEGFIKVFVKDNFVNGACIVGPEASTLIAEVALAVRNKLSLEQIISTIHAHPTLPEVFVEAVKNALGEAIHLPKA